MLFLQHFSNYVRYSDLKKENGSRAPGCTNQVDKNSNKIILVAIIIIA